MPGLWRRPAHAKPGNDIGMERGIRALLIGIFMLMVGSGALTTLVSVRLTDSGATAGAIGLVATSYFVGLIFGSILIFRVIARVGHIRAFAACVSLFSATALVYALGLDVPLWALLRFAEGFCMAGVFVCIESWLTQTATAQQRGSVLAFYMIALYAGQAAGQFLLNLGTGAAPFIAASMFLSLAVLPVALTRGAPPALPELKSLGLVRLYHASPLGIVGAVATGIILGAFYGFGPVFARGLGFDAAAIANFMSAAIAGGIALQWPLGRLSDLFDRRKVILGALAAATAASIAVLLLGADYLQLLIAIALFGGIVFALYPLCVAHTNDHLQEAERLAATGGLVLAYSAGAAVGPLAGAVANGLIGIHGLFLVTAATSAAALVFGLWRLVTASAVPGDQQQPYRFLPRTTPAVGSLAEGQSIS